MYQVGEAPSMDFSMLKGAAKIAAEDAARREHLNQRARIVTPDEERAEAVPCRICREVLHENCAGPFCRRCAKMLSMRKARRQARLAAVDDRKAKVPCRVCGTPIDKWSPSNTLRRVCDGCVTEAKRRRHIREVAP